MTKEDRIKRVVRKLDELDGFDSEGAHCEADDILLKCLRDIGAGDVADAFNRAAERITFWYA